MKWLINFILPPIKYWIIFHNPHQKIYAVRQRFNPGLENTSQTFGVITLDGPHDTQEEAVQRLTFWKAQYENNIKQIKRT